MPREFTRSDRVASQFQRELATLLRSEVKDTRLGLVTLNEVEITRDMSLARAYVSFLGATEIPKQCVKILNEYVPRLRHAMCGLIRLRVMPELRFVYDESIDRGMKIDELLKGIAPPPIDGEDQGESL